MLDILAAASADIIRFEDLGLSPHIDLGFFQLKYYSLAYLIGLLFAYWHLSRMITYPGAPMGQVHVDDLFFYCTLGVILGGRLGYATFYDPSLWTTFEEDAFVSWRVLRLWDGGMSFHGGLLGVGLAVAWVAWRGKLPLIRVCDYISVNVGVGMLLGRLANFVNGELWGREAGPDAPIRMIFPSDPAGLARHPSQLYQAFGEGLVVLVVMLSLFWFTRARFRTGLLFGTFAVLMGAARITNEFFRQPDVQLTEFAERTGFSMGQWLSMPLVLLGIGMIVWSLTRAPLGFGKTAPKAGANSGEASEAGAA